MFKPWVNPPTQLAPAPRGPVLRPRPLGDMDPILGQVGTLTPTQKAMLFVHGVILLGSAYHGYVRNENSILWGGSWAASALICPTVTTAFALSQGFGRPRKS